MALTPEDVLNKTFTQTQFRRGYDEREVDDFLDEVVAEMRRMVKDSEDLRARAQDGSGSRPAAVADTGKADEALTRENRELRSRLEDLRSRFDKETAARAAAEKRATELEQIARTNDDRAKGDAANLSKAQQGADERIATVNARAEEAEASAQERIKAANAAAEKAEAEAKARQAEAAKAPVAAAEDSGASGLIALAQRLHDEHVAEGQTQRDKLIAEAKRRHDELVSAGQSKHDELLSTGQSKHDEFIKTGQGKRDQFISEAEAQRKKILDDLNAQKSKIETKIAELTTYERDYRRKLKDYLSGQLKGLETSESVAPEQTVKH